MNLGILVIGPPEIILAFQAARTHTSVMVIVKQRRRINTVTTQVPILISAESGEHGYPASFLAPMEQPSLVREFQETDFRRVLLGLREDEKAHFVSLVELITALQRNDPLALERAIERLEKSLERRPEPPPSKISLFKGQGKSHGLLLLLISILRLHREEMLEGNKNWHHLTPKARKKEDARWLLSRQLSERIEDVKLVLWWTGKVFTPALYCQHEPSALYVRALLGLARTTKTLVVCPHCGTPFIQERTDQQYCSVAHREAHRVARWRARKNKSKKAQMSTKRSR